MAVVYPFSQRTAARLAEPPEAGATHRWLAQVASGVSHMLTPAKCAEFLRRCCDVHVAHRRVPDREIEAAVQFAYAEHSTVAVLNYGRGALEWPECNRDLIREVMEKTDPVFDGETSTGLRPGDVLPHLFRSGELVCTGADSERATVRPLDDVLTDAECLQFICVNPMRGSLAVNLTGHPSARCQNNVMVRRYLVAEFDDAALTKRQQAQLASSLGHLAPLVMAVDSGGKSVHAWYFVESLSRQNQTRFFMMCCLIGADRTRWDICGWLRMPGGLRVKADDSRVRQRILYWNGDAIGVAGFISTLGFDEHEETKSA
jgi:hypothetical protein